LLALTRRQLLPPYFRKPRYVRKSPAIWPALRMADRHWTYAALQVMYWTAWIAIAAPVSAAPLTAGLVLELSHSPMRSVGWFIAAGFAALSGVLLPVGGPEVLREAR